MNKIVSKLRLLGLFFLIFAVGCGHQATPKIESGDEIVLTVRFKGNVDLSQYSYFILVSPTQTPVVPNLNHYFTAPGLVFQESRLDNEGLTLADYYTQFFGSWSAFFQIGETSDLIKLYNGPFAIESESDHFLFTDVLGFSATNQSGTNTFSYRFSLSFLDGLFDQLYVTFVVATKQNGVLFDVLDTDPILLETRNTQSRFGFDDSFTPAPADMVSWSAEII